MSIIILCSIEQGIENFAQWLTTKSHKEQNSFIQAIKRFFEKLKDTVKSLVNRSDFNPYQKSFLQMQEQQLNDLSKQWLSALDTAISNSKQKNNTTDSMGVKFSIREDNLGKYVDVDTDQHIIEGKTLKESISIINKYMDKKFRGKVFPVSYDSKAYVGHIGVDEYSHPAKRNVDNDILFSKLKAGTELDNLLAVSVFDEHTEDDGHHPEAVGGWDYYRTVFKVGNNFYEGKVSIEIRKNGREFKDITKIKGITRTANQNTNVSVDTSNSSNTNVPQNNTDVNNNSMQGKEKYSLDVDSKGNKLSAQQQEYFKDSKALDENGNLLVLYHQTGADFTIFNTDNQKAGKYDSEMPTGIFLKPTPNDIGLSGKKQMKVYANMVNPLVFNNRSEAIRYYERNIPGYKEAQQRISDIDKEYQKKYDETDLKDDEIYKQLFEDFKQKRITSQEFKEGVENTQTKRILNEWRNASDNARLEAKLLLDSYFANSEYDGMIVKNDAGSFGRSVTSYIAFNSNQIKNVDNINPTDNADIRYSVNVDDVLSVKEQLKKYADKLILDNAVVQINTSNYDVNFDNKQALRKFVDKEFSPIYEKGGIEREDGIFIEFTNKLVNRGLNYLKTKGEKISLLAVPKVIENGKIISERDNHKNRNYPTYTIAAPIEIDGLRGNVAVIVTVVGNGRNRYKVHRILLPNGSKFEIENKKDAEQGSYRISKSETLLTSSVSNTNVPQNDTDVNNNSMQGNRKNALDVEKEIKALRKRNEYLELAYEKQKQEFQLTHGRVTDENAAKNLATWILNERWKGIAEEIGSIINVQIL